MKFVDCMKFRPSRFCRSSINKRSIVWIQYLIRDEKGHWFLKFLRALSVLVVYFDKLVGFLFGMSVWGFFLDTFSTDFLFKMSAWITKIITQNRTLETVGHWRLTDPNETRAKCTVKSVDLKVHSQITSTHKYTHKVGPLTQ